MTNKLPEVGKRYRLRNKKNPYVVEILPIVSVRDEISGTVKEYGIEIFNDIYEELPEDNADFSLGKAEIICKRCNEPISRADYLFRSGKDCFHIGCFEEKVRLDKSSQSEVEKAKEKKDFKSNCGYCGGSGGLMLPSNPPQWKKCNKCQVETEVAPNREEEMQEPLQFKLQFKRAGEWTPVPSGIKFGTPEFIEWFKKECGHDPYSGISEGKHEEKHIYISDNVDFRGDSSNQSEVEKAKEELRREIASCKYIVNSSDVILEGLFNKAKNLLNALDSQKEPELRDKKSCLSERETKLPWKDVSELPAIDFKAMIDLARYHLREIRSDTVGKPRDIPNAVESLTNIVESMLSRQDELENLIRKPSAEGKPSCVDWSFIYDSGLTPEQILICELMIQRQDELEERVRKLEGK